MNRKMHLLNPEVILTGKMASDFIKGHRDYYQTRGLTPTGPLYTPQKMDTTTAAVVSTRDQRE